ncbi:NurA domain-containing protein [Natronoarchaeum philippinense]|uniref:NurA domain-containing protein n=1 Tax=Natronoarchaeum philippinense TaxID=558529 RepID=A0A285NXE8_NATPI|nr:DNA double-strand break repair nuclease NurA [Natronoarchaeum philippinense]SNZ12321.1 NurA domain-containing protein [Natronoarchaeum philippinense]
MDSESLGIVREMFEAVDQAVPREPTSQADHARQLFELLAREGGHVEAIGEPQYWRTRIDELGTWSDDPWAGATYGVDAGTTRPIEYNNGLVVDTAYAKTAVAGNDDGGEIERTGHITGVAYFDDDDSTLHAQTFDGDNVTAELIPFPQPAKEPRNIGKSVASVAQRMSESRQALASVESVDGPLFLDGAVLPLGIVYWLLLDYTGGRSPAGSWDVPADIVGNYIEVIDRQYERDQPVIGIVKTSSLSQLLSSLREKIASHNIRDDSGRLVSVPWTRDHQFMSEVLRFDDLEYLTYTSWFVQQSREIQGQHVEALEPISGRGRHGDAEAYRRAFCYVRLPKTGDLLRIEAPYLMVKDEDMREQMRLKALKEIAQRRGVPRAIHRADRLARISRENRDTIRDMIERTEYSYDHNWDGRWSDIEEDPEL